MEQNEVYKKITKITNELKKESNRAAAVLASSFLET